MIAMTLAMNFKNAPLRQQTIIDLQVLCIAPSLLVSFSGLLIPEEQHHMLTIGDMPCLERDGPPVTLSWEQVCLRHDVDLERF
jgi:hypothetical protein